MEVFSTLVEQMKRFSQKLKLVNFAYLGEPLLNNNISKMVKMVKEADVAERVEIVTNASALTEDLSKELVESGLDRLRISIQGIDQKQYLDISQYKIDYKRFIYEIEYIYKLSRRSE